MNMTPSRLGQINQAGDDRELYLKMYGGEVLTSFDETNVFKDKHIIRSIAAGKSAQFPVTGKKTARYHTPGELITGSKMNHGEKVITIDDPLIAESFIANVDEAINHYEIRSEYTKQDGAALARQYDKDVAATALNAARSSATLTDGYGGSIIESATFLTSADALIGGLFDAAQAFDEKDVPMDERYCFVKPAQAYLLAESDRVSNRNSEQVGSFAKGSVGEIAGIQIIKTNNLPQEDLTGGFKSEYDGNFSTTAALVMQRGAVGTVQLKELSVESDYLVQNQGTLMVSKYLLGHGILRPECAIELRTGTPT